MAEENAVPFTLTYSGGAVPDLHRSSLFVGSAKSAAPTTNARLAASLPSFRPLVSLDAAILFSQNAHLALDVLEAFCNNGGHWVAARPSI